MKMVNIGGLSLRLETSATLEGVVEISGGFFTKWAQKPCFK